MTFAAVRASYGARADECVAAFGSIDHAADPDRALIEAWALGIEGPVLDVGCGAGQWTHHLADLGVDVEGVDPVPEFIERARAAYPDQRYRLGRAEDLDVVDGALGGVLAWYSLIHTDPARIGDALAEFARGIRPGGGLALGFFTGPEVEPFAHAIVTAYYWPVDLLTSMVESAGFTVVHTETRTDPGVRSHGAIVASRRR
ncbi:SAM-dependent methyltransferase [Microbacterium resistens]|uniref:SAM-dependent methyltransferase n=1 Tax=Microbacterium resistens TaxID=156977 RepID=A0ABU1S834_9MICO|nr:class I SAM-dependent methyltransferase [Microbacterium resistens]MDR6865761.1 SAM-dependent methyltransferase [Microbacterium resistens]